MISRATIFALSLTLGSTPALAAPQTDQLSATVRIDDLRLASAEGQQRLDARIKSAARAVCRSGGRSIADRMLDDQCIAAAVEGAQPHAERAIALARSGTQLALLIVPVAK